MLADVSAQKATARVKAPLAGMVLPVECNVMANGGRAEGFTLRLFQDNKLVQEIPVRKASALEVELDLNANYTIMFTKAGFRDKLISMDTHLPKHQTRYDKYICHVNLEPVDKFAHSDMFYLDFPGALVRWDATKRAFSHNDNYLADIQYKVALLGAQMETR